MVVKDSLAYEQVDHIIAASSTGKTSETRNVVLLSLLDTLHLPLLTTEILSALIPFSRMSGCSVLSLLESGCRSVKKATVTLGSKASAVESRSEQSMHRRW